MGIRVLEGDARARLAELPEGSVRCCVTSPPYWGLRDYGVAGQLGLERTPEEYVTAMVDVFRGVRRALADDGTCWVNLGDSYVASPNGNRDTSSSTLTSRSDGSRKRDLPETGRIGSSAKSGQEASDLRFAPHRGAIDGLKPKDMVGIPWLVAFALRADGWWLRQDIVWSKPNPMPESVRDRCTKAHEYVFLLSKSARYYFNADAIAEEVSLAAQIGSERANGGTRPDRPMKAVVRGGVNPKAAMNAPGSRQNESMSSAICLPVSSRNKRSVWTIATQPFSEAHFATFPPKLVEPCVLAGSEPGDAVLDPFAGAGTTLLVADRLGRDGIGIELNPEYAEMARRRITADAPLFHAGNE